MNRSVFLRYLAALGAVLLATAIRLLLDPILGDQSPAATYIVAVVFAAWYGGVGPALAAVAVGTLLSTYLFIPPRYSLVVPDLNDQVALAIQVFVAVVTALLSGSLRTAQRNAAASAQAASNRSELLRITLTSMGDGVISTDNLGRVVFLNPAARALTGWSHEEAVGRPLTDVYCVNDAPTRLEMATILACGPDRQHPDPSSRHTTILARDGTRRIVEQSLAAIREGANLASGAVLVFHDVSKRKRDEEIFQFLARSSIALAESLDLASTIAKVARLPIPQLSDWCLVEVLENPEADTSGCIVSAAHRDPNCEPLLAQLASSAASGGPPHRRRLLPLTDTQWTAELTDDVLRQSVSSESDLAMLRQLQVRSWLTVPLRARDRTLGAVRFGVGEPGRSYAADDIAWAEDFARRAASAIENAQLYHQAREADRRKDEFLAVLGHELRNPLAPLRNSLHLLKVLEPHEPDARHAGEMMEEQVEHLIRLVDDLLDVSRITRGKVSLRNQLLDLRDVIRRAVHACRPLIDARNHELLVSMPDTPVIVDGDAIRLTQVVENLLNNAVKYTEKSGRIWLDCERCPEGNEVRVRVRDNGIGVTPGMLTRIFDPFIQAAFPEDEPQGGLGIGLTLVRTLVELHGGQVQGTSAGPGQGSEFVVRLPLAVTGAAVAPAIPEAPAEPPGSTLPPVVSGRRVLVVEDNLQSARSLVALLRIWRHTVEFTVDPLEALEIADVFQPEIVLVDIGLPRLNGYDLARQLRHRLPGVRLVAITGYGQEDDRRRSAEAGIDCHLVKPVDPAALERMLGTSPVATLVS